MPKKLQTHASAVAELDHEHGLHLLRQMVRIRRLEDKSAELYGAQKIRGFLHLYNGEEAVAVGVIETLRPEDCVVATYREHGQALARGVSMKAIMAEMFGKQEGCSRGRGGSMHLFDASTRFYGGNAIVAGGLPLAVGLALADKMQGRSVVTCCFFGDGAVQEGEFHESMSLASLWKLPVLFVCENNLFAMGVPLERSEPVPNLAKKADAYAVPAATVNGMDVLAVETQAHKAVAHVRSGKGSYFLECITYRFRAHSMFDAELYRKKEDVERWRQQDPIVHLAGVLKERGLVTDAQIKQLEREADAQIAEAVAYADAGTLEPLEDLTRFVYSEQGAS